MCIYFGCLQKSGNIQIKCGLLPEPSLPGICSGTCNNTDDNGNNYGDNYNTNANNNHNIKGKYRFLSQESKFDYYQIFWVNLNFKQK